MGVSICSGTTPGAVKQTFVQSERKAYKNNALPVFTRFLKKVYCKCYLTRHIAASVYSLSSERRMSFSSDAWNHFD